MKLYLNGKTVELVFQHHVELLAGLEGTIAAFIDKDGNRLKEAYALRNPVDQYCKATGRKVALARLIKELPRGTRSQVWRAYWNSINKSEFALEKTSGYNNPDGN